MHIKIKQVIPLIYKDGNPADNIELVTFEDYDFHVITQKGRFKVGDKGFYIEPDYCVPDTELFLSYAPKLGGGNRVRAIKFNNFSTTELAAPIFSNGILLTFEDIAEHANLPMMAVPTYENLGVTKYTPNQSKQGGLNHDRSSDFPTWISKTDETNIRKIPNEFKEAIAKGIQLVGTRKVDGSSISFGLKDGKPFVCSRRRNLPLEYEKVTGFRKPNFLERWGAKIFGYKPKLEIREIVESESDFVVAARPILDRILDYNTREFYITSTNIVFRGELNGGNAKGSGNKNNYDKGQPLNIKLFGVELSRRKLDWEPVNFQRGNYMEFQSYVRAYSMVQCDEIFNRKFESYDELKAVCEGYFKDNKKAEGIVIRSFDGTLSAKYMNEAYDAKKS